MRKYNFKYSKLIKKDSLEKIKSRILYKIFYKIFFYASKIHKEIPGDIAYWTGYKIAESYYENSSDKKRTLK
ncbi:hypothetical protein SAMN05421741_11346 [Paenimyroides ummariense]|uniref:Uncharacterized protein n=1 Tax=Paenimyroides ummariense TaxID=913024 RepID=A0A1I5CTL7_9FLAO|nr:hypothetical protein SAMN05421741_11346 [Paenimyroides ummariense]